MCIRDSYQGFSSINAISTRLWQEWNGLEAQVKHPVNKSVYVAATYTWSHDTSNNGVVDPYHLNRFRGNASGLNYPQSFAVTVLYKLPFFEHGNQFEKLTMGGWSINDISTFRSGSSITPGVSFSTSGLTSRPFVVPGLSLIHI